MQIFSQTSPSSQSNSLSAPTRSNDAQQVVVYRKDKNNSTALDPQKEKVPANPLQDASTTNITILPEKNTNNNNTTIVEHRFEQPLLLTNASTENLLCPSFTTEEKPSTIKLSENTKYSQKDNLQTTFGNCLSNTKSLNHSTDHYYHNQSPSLTSQYSLKNNSKTPICENSTLSTCSTLNHNSNYYLANCQRTHRSPSSPLPPSTTSSNNNNNTNYYYYYIHQQTPVNYPHQHQQEPILVLTSSIGDTNPVTSSRIPVQLQSSDLYHQHYQQQRTRSHSLPLPRQTRQLKTFQLTSTLDERIQQYPSTNMPANNNLTVVQYYDNNSSASVSPLSPMPLLSDGGGNIDSYKDQFMALVKQGSAELLNSEKECFAVLGTCPKSNTKVAYWYGKYGGPFTWRYTGVPIDDLDLVCRMHDQRLPLKYVKKLVNLIRKQYGDNQLSKDALSYIKKIDGLAFRIIEPVYMTFFGCF